MLSTRRLLHRFVTHCDMNICDVCAEPNLLSHTAHSISRKGVRRRDLNDVELREILAELLPHVRVDHILPRSHDLLLSAVRRGLVSQPPSHMLGKILSPTSICPREAEELS